MLTWGLFLSNFALAMGIILLIFYKDKYVYDFSRSTLILQETSEKCNTYFFDKSRNYELSALIR